MDPFYSFSTRCTQVLHPYPICKVVSTYPLGNQVNWPPCLNISHRKKKRLRLYICCSGCNTLQNVALCLILEPSLVIYIVSQTLTIISCIFLECFGPICHLGRISYFHIWVDAWSVKSHCSGFKGLYLFLWVILNI